MSGEIEEFQEPELSGENGEVYVFQWLAATDRVLLELPIGKLKACQAATEKTLLKIISASAPYPSPGRALRNLTSRCLITMYTRGESRTLFDTMQALLRIVDESKPGEKDMHKIAALSCFGDLMATFGAQFMSFVAEVVALTLKLAKSGNSPLLRYHALSALSKSLKNARKAVMDSAARDIMKQMKNALTDKNLPVQRGASDVIIAMFSHCDGVHPSISQIDALLSQCVKSLDHADQTTRRSHAQLVGYLLSTTQVERVAESAKNRKEPEGVHGDTNTPVHAVAEATKPLLSTSEMLLRISAHYNKPHLSRKAHIGLFDFYIALLARLGSVYIENHYAVIVAHLMSEIVSGPRAGSSRYDKLLVRSLMGILLRDFIGVRMLSEQGQISAIQDLANSYLKRWPALMPGQVAPSSETLVIALREVSGLLQQLGNSPPPVQDALCDPLMTLLSHPSHSVRVASSWTLRCFCYSSPLRLPRCILGVADKLQRDLASLLTPAGPTDISKRCLGHAYALSALVSVIPEKPLYVSYDVSAKVLDIATQLLKLAGEHDLAISGVEIEVAWTLIASLTTLGPNFVRPHLPQLLVLWRNALPKPTSKDAASNAERSISEWLFLLQVRESALTAVLCFLNHNSSLVTLDTARRVASLLGNALLFISSFVAQNVEDPLESQMPPDNRKGLSLRDREALLRRRIYQCFSTLGFSSIPEATQKNLLQSAVSLFASPDGYAGSALQAAITSSSGSFTSVWQSSDGYAYGVTSNDVLDFGDAERMYGGGQVMDYLNRDNVEVATDMLLRKPILCACEHDVLSVIRAKPADGDCSVVEPPPPATAVVDAAIDLFAKLLPLHDVSTVMRILNTLLESVRSPKLDKNIGRRAAAVINANVAILMTLRNVTTSASRHAQDVFGNSQVTTLLSPFLKEAIIDGDLVLRSAASESFGRLANCSSVNFLTAQIKDLVDIVVNNRDPNARAGCALTFGAIYTYVGGLAAGPLLKTTVNILMSLSNDPHPVVHFWSLHALARVINAASLAYGPFVSSTLGMLLKVYLLESHERESGMLSSANTSAECPAYPVVCQIIDAVINILGPDMQDSPRTRTLVLNLVHEFLLEEDESICVEAIRCIQHFLMFVPEHANVPELVVRFRGHMSSSRRSLKIASINALYQLVQKDALAVSKLGGDRLVEDLFRMLDDDSSVEGVKNVISSWLHQTVAHNPSAWIDLCQRIMSYTTASQREADAALRRHTRDDEGESLNQGGAQAADKGRLTSRWRTQVFALQCLHDICTIVARSGREEHLNVVTARARGVPVANLLFTRVTDLIKMAFTASTAYVTEIRLSGLTVLRDVIEIFSVSPDPAYEKALLLEQHQAPITAALTPAFSADSTPEILASAIHACALFVGCGVVKEVNRMGRILKLLTTALQQSKESGLLSIGEAGHLSPSASTMLRIATITAWAQLQLSSQHQPYLETVIQPHRSTLAQLWVAALRDYASIIVDPEFVNDLSSLALDSSYSSLGKEFLLPYYVKSWHVILHAIATSMQANDKYILAAMDGQELLVNSAVQSTRKNGEHSAFFYVLFGLIYEALSMPSSDAADSPDRQAIVVACVQALKSLVRPEYSGNAIMEPTIFEEFISLCHRLAFTEPPAIQVHLVDMLTILASTRSDPKMTQRLGPRSPSTHCLKICAGILQNCNSSKANTQGQASDISALFIAAFAAFASIAASADASEREDIRGIAAVLYSEQLKDESSEFDLISLTFPALKSILDIPVLPDEADKRKYDQLVHALLSSCLLNIDEMRGRHGRISAKKIKSNLLASVLILTAIPSTVKIGKAVVERCCFLISQKLVENDEISLTAAHCARSLIVTSVPGAVLLRQCAKLLIPALVGYLVKVAPLVHEDSVAEHHTLVISEIWKCFSVLFIAAPEEHRARILGVYLPTLSLLLTNPDESPITKQTVAHLLSYATSSPAAFKEATGRLDPSARELLEQSIRRAVNNVATPNIQGSAKPQIALKSF